MVKMKVKRLHPEAKLPRYQTAGAACFDLHVCAPGSEPADMGDFAAATFDTGLAFEVPSGHVLLIFSRSGHGFSHDVRLANCVGVIDSDYRGGVSVRLTSDNTARPLIVSHGDRIAQAMLLPIPSVELVEVDELSATARGGCGFGSTGQ